MNWHQAGWLGFGAVCVGLLTLDVLVLNRRTRALTVKQASFWSAVIVTTALLFGIYVWALHGTTTALEYYAGYLVELSLSIDNLFVFILIFEYFAVPATARPKVLTCGILGAVLMRGVMVAIGTVVLNRFDWLFVVLGVVLLYTAAKMFRSDEERIEPEKNPLVKLFNRLLPVTQGYEGSAFFVKSRRGWMATPLFVVIPVVAWSDVVFAIDSIPAIFAITRDPFIVYTSNVFAVLGLRALFFVIAEAMKTFQYVKPGVGIILGFVGIKMILSHWMHMPIQISLVVIVGVLAGSIILSILKQRRTAAS